MFRKTLLALAAAIACTGAMPAPQGNPLANVTRTPARSHIVGNLDAPNYLVEYVSYTCGLCAAFEREGADAVKLQYVGSGKLKMEVRHLLLNIIDLTVATAVQCQPKDRFFTAHSMMLKRQDEWLPLASKANAAQRTRWSRGTPRQRMQAVASDIGLYDLMESTGLERTELDRCFGDASVYNPIVAQSTQAQEGGLNATPTFVLNGRRLTTRSAAGLSEILGKALAPAP